MSRQGSRTFKWSACSTLCAALIFLSACSGSSPTADVSGDSGVKIIPAPASPVPGKTLPDLSQLTQSLPAVPQSGATRRGQAVRTLELSGSGAQSLAATASIDEAAGTASLVSGPGAVCWALYRFSGITASDLPAWISVELSGLLPADCYIATVDAQQEKWVWTTVDSPAAEIGAYVPLGNGPAADGSLFCLLAVYGGESLAVSRVSLVTQAQAPPPIGLSAMQGSANSIDLSWQRPALSYAQQGAGAAPFVADSLKLEYATAAGGPWLLLSDNPAQSRSFKWATVGAGLGPQLGQEYFFRLRTVREGEAGPPGNPVRGSRELMPPTPVTAIDGTYFETIILSWPPVENAESYDVYARRLDFPGMDFLLIANVDSGQFRHYRSQQTLLPLVFNVDYEYFVRSRSGAVLSAEPSNTVTARRGLPAPQNVVASQGDFDDRIIVSWDKIPGVASYGIAKSLLPDEHDTNVDQLEQFVEATSQARVSAVIDLHDFEQEVRNQSFYLHVAAMVPDRSYDAMGPLSAPALGFCNKKPEARLSLGNTIGAAPLVVALDASASSSPESPIVEYRWDFDGDGSSDFSSGIPQVTHSYEPGMQLVPAVTVVDADGDSTTASAQTAISSGGWLHSWQRYSHMEVRKLATAEDGSSYAAMRAYANLGYQSEILMKRGLGSELLWVRELDPVWNWRIKDLAAGGPQPSLLLAKYLSGGAVSTNAVAALGANGQVTSCRQYDFSSMGEKPSVGFLAADAAGNRYLAGLALGAIAKVSFAAKLDPVGAVLWSVRLSAEDSGWDLVPTGLCPTASGGLLVCGRCSGPGLSSAGSWFELNAAGQLVRQGRVVVDGKDFTEACCASNGRLLFSYRQAYGEDESQNGWVGIDAGNAVEWCGSLLLAQGAQAHQARAVMNDKAEAAALFYLDGSFGQSVGLARIPPHRLGGKLQVWKIAPGYSSEIAWFNGASSGLLIGGTARRLAPQLEFAEFSLRPEFARVLAMNLARSEQPVGSSAVPASLLEVSDGLTDPHLASEDGSLPLGEEMAFLLKTP